MSLTEYIINLYEPYRDRMQALEKEWEFHLEKFGKPRPSYLRDVVLPAIDQGPENEEIHRDLWATALYYAYQEYPPDEILADISAMGHARPRLDSIEKYYQRKFCCVSYGDSLYVYQNNVFQENRGQIEAQLKKDLEKLGATQGRNFKPLAEEIIYRLRVISNQHEYPFNARNDVINCRNTVITRTPWVRELPRSPVWGFTYMLPCNYNPRASPDRVLNFINSIVDKQDVDFLLQIPAQAILCKNYQIAYLLVGPGANGKSTYLRLIRAFLGERNCVSIPLNDICNDQFAAAELQGKLINIFADIPKKPVKNLGIFKALTGGDVLSVQKKYKNRFEMRSRAVMLFSANELPRVDDDTYAFWRRWAVIECNRIFKVNPDFELEIISDENLSGLLNEVIRRMNRIDIEGLRYSHSADSIRERWQRKTDSVYAWIAEALIRDPAAYILKGEAYQAYVEFCQQNDMLALSIQRFAEKMQSHRAIADIVGGARDRKRVWRGYRFRTEPEAPGALETARAAPVCLMREPDQAPIIGDPDGEEA